MAAAGHAYGMARAAPDISLVFVLLYRFYCIFGYHVLIFLDLYFVSWAAVRA